MNFIMSRDVFTIEEQMVLKSVVEEVQENKPEWLSSSTILTLLYNVVATRLQSSNIKISCKSVEHIHSMRQQMSQTEAYNDLVCLQKLRTKLFERRSNLNVRFTGGPTSKTIERKRRKTDVVFDREELLFATPLFNCLRTAPKNHKTGGFEGVRYHFAHLWSVGVLLRVEGLTERGAEDLFILWDRLNLKTNRTEKAKSNTMLVGVRNAATRAEYAKAKPAKDQPATPAPS